MPNHGVCEKIRYTAIIILTAATPRENYWTNWLLHLQVNKHVYTTWRNTVTVAYALFRCE